MITTADAPSFMPEALPAVTDPVPSRRKAGRSLASFSRVVSGLGCLSVSNTKEDLRSWTSTGRSSSLKSPASWAFFHFIWLS